MFRLRLHNISILRIGVHVEQWSVEMMRVLGFGSLFSAERLSYECDIVVNLQCACAGLLALWPVCS